MRFAIYSPVFCLLFSASFFAPSGDARGQSAIVSPAPGYTASDIFLDRAPESFGALGTNLALFEKSTGLQVANPADGSTVLSLGMPDDYFAAHTHGGTVEVWSSFIAADPSLNSLWVGFTCYNNTDDRIYQVDLSGQWTQKTSLSGNLDMQFSGTKAFISANASGMSTGRNAIWELDAATNQLVEVARVGGYSVGLGADRQGNVYYSTYISGAEPQSLYRFTVSQIANAVLLGTPLTSGSAEKLADFANGGASYDLDVDAADNVVFNLNAGDQSGSVSSKIAVWNGIAGGGPNYDVIGAGSGQSRWYTMLETAGNVRESGGTVYVQDYFSPGIAQLTRTGNYWEGGSTVDSFWKTPENWSTGAAPQANDKLYFAGTARLTAENDFPLDTTFGGIVFTNSAGAFVLHGNRVALSGEIANQSSNLQTLELGIVIAGGNITFDAGSMGIAMNAVISEADPGADLIKKGMAALTLSRANTYSGETHVVEGNLTILGSILQSSEVNVTADAELTLAGTSGSSLSPGTAIENDGLILIAATGQQCGSIVGSGIVSVPNGSGLTALTIVQSTLSIGGAAMPSQVPEPSSLVLLVAFGMAGFALIRQQYR